MAKVPFRWRRSNTIALCLLAVTLVPNGIIIPLIWFTFNSVDDLKTRVARIEGKPCVDGN